MDELEQKLADLLKEKFPDVYGFFQGESHGFLITDQGQQFVLELRPREEQESFTLFGLGE